MRVTKKRWGEVTVKKQGERGKNHFDKTRSFSIEEAGKNYSLEHYIDILKVVTDITQEMSYKELSKRLKAISIK